MFVLVDELAGAKLLVSAVDSTHAHFSVNENVLHPLRPKLINKANTIVMQTLLNFIRQPFSNKIGTNNQ